MTQAILMRQVGGRPAPPRVRAGAGMATYRLGFYDFDELALAGGPDHACHPLAAVDARFRLARSAPSLTPVLVDQRKSGGRDRAGAAGDPWARIATDSSFGVEGEAVDLAFRLTIVGDDVEAHRLTCDVLAVGGSPVGLLAATALKPGVTYRVTDAVATDPSARIGEILAGHGPVIAAEGPALTWEAVFCFTSGTLIDTPEGPQPVEGLCPGNLVTTIGNGSQPLRWIGRRHVRVAEMLASPRLQPVEFAAGVIGNLGPLRVSPLHRILLNDWRAQVFFGEDEVLIPAKALLNGGTIRQVLPPEGVTYVHLLFDRHEILVTGGALSESFHPGETGLLSLDAAQRREVELLFPGPELIRRRAAFPIVKLSEARALRLPD